MTISPAKLLSVSLLSLTLFLSNTAFSATFTISPHDDAAFPNTPGALTANYIVGEVITFTSTTFDAGPAQANINNNWDFGDSKNVQYNIQNAQETFMLGLNASKGTDILKTITHKFGSPGTYVVTLASQTNFPDLVELKALTTTLQQTIVVDADPNAAAPGITTPIAELYLKHCADCHGKVIPGTNKVDDGLHSNLSKYVRDTGNVTATLITEAYTLYPKFMGAPGIRRLNVAEAPAMADYINSLVPNVDAAGNAVATAEEIYTATCAPCHGTGSGAYALPVAGQGWSALTTQSKTESAIIRILEMRTLALTTEDIIKVSEFLAASLTADAIPKPTDGPGLYVMYCSYCHGLDGAGGAFVKDESIRGESAESIMKAIKENDDDNMMGYLINSLNANEIKLIANTL